MEINGVSPLPHYFEEIYTNQIGLPAIGIRGDKNYLFYSIDGLGSGYYEETEKRLSADSVYDYFAKPGQRSKFFHGIDNVIKELQAKTSQINKLDLNSLGVKELAKHFLEANELHGRIFTYYVVSQPYRMYRFERQLREELGKRVAASRVDTYMTLLATSNQPTKITREELSWLKFLIKYKTKYGSSPLNTATLKTKRPDMYDELMKHFDEYKILTLGDGNWDYNLKFFLHNLRIDYRKDLKVLKKRYEEAKNHSKYAEKQRLELIKDLYLDKETIENTEFLANVGHTRLVMRIEGWIPFVATIIKLDIALSIKLDHSAKAGPLLNFMTYEELRKLATTGIPVPDEELIRRRGKRLEYAILHDHGESHILYGAEAGKKFRELVPPINHKITTELKGATAVRGRIVGTVCVYHWGDSIPDKQKIIRKHPILVAGQTRPAMMPIIRLAKGIVTDEGGITSHAAIVSRELGIPSVIGTIHATQVFKDGDRVELDADHGIVRKLS